MTPDSTGQDHCAEVLANATGEGARAGGHNAKAIAKNATAYGVKTVAAAASTVAIGNASAVSATARPGSITVAHNRPSPRVRARLPWPHVDRERRQSWL